MLPTKTAHIKIVYNIMNVQYVIQHGAVLTIFCILIQRIIAELICNEIILAQGAAFNSQETKTVGQKCGQMFAMHRNIMLTSDALQRQELVL